MNEKIFDLLLKEEEISWKTIIYDLVEAEGMSPWNIDIKLLTGRYIQVIKEMKEHDLRISGKILLAAAILLKIKSTHLIENDFSKLDKLINETEEDFEEDFFEEINENGERLTRVKEQYTLIPRNPQPRNRKVSVEDLVDALQRAMASKKRVLAKIKPTKFKMPAKGIDIMGAIRDVYNKIQYYSNKEKNKKITFSKLLPQSASKMDKVFTFLPLLHLENQHKLNMHQKESFAEIDVHLIENKRKKV